MILVKRASWMVCALAACLITAAARAADSADAGNTGQATVRQQGLGEMTGMPATSRDWQSRRGLYYKRNWGVEIIGVKPVSSGYMLAFRYRVIDPEKARLLNDRQSKAYLRDEATGTILAVPAMENVGELRTGAKPVADRTYFMVFGNPGKLVKSGSRVTVVAGTMHVDGMIVD